MRIGKWLPIVAMLVAVSACSDSAAEDAPAAATVDEASAAGAPSTEAASSAASTAPPAPAARAVPAPAPVIVPAGTPLTIVLSEPLSSGTNNAGDAFAGNLAAAVLVDGRTVIEKGAAIQGKVVEAEGSGRVKGLATLSLQLTSVSVNGRNVAIETRTYFQEAESTTGRDAGVIGGGAGIGAVIGAIAGGKKGAATGAAIGGAAGTGTVLATKGKEVELPAETRLEFILERQLTM